MAQSWEEAIHQLYIDAGEVLAQINHGPQIGEMPERLPPVAQRIWNLCKAIQVEIESQACDDLS